MASSKLIDSKIQLGKHLQLSKAQTTTFGVAAVAIFLIVFSIFAAISLLKLSSYQGRVVSAKQTALNQLKTNQKMANELVKSYGAFISTSTNAIGGNPKGNGAQDGSNAKLVLDALPDKYDFPSLASSLEGIITGQNMTIKSISGQDEQTTQETNISSATPQTVPMPFTISAGGNYGQVQSLIGQLEHSIRPFQIQTLDLKGDQDNMVVSVTAQTYFQPAKNFKVQDKVLK